MRRCAALLIDLQHDFIGGAGARLPVDAGAVASGRPWKKRCALWSMRRAGATILPDLVAGAP